MTAAVIEIDGLVKRFGGFSAVDGVSLGVRPGQVHGFLGPNGAGKSTTIRVMLGFLRPTGGRVRLHGLDPATRAAAVTRRTSYVPGDVALWGNLTGQEVLDALAGLRGAYDRDYEKRLVDAFALDPRKKIRIYSKGNRQKVMLVAAFAARTDLLVLDEPTSGLDPLMEQVFQDCVRRAADAGRAVLLSSHLLAEVEHLCESVTIIKDGRPVDSGTLTAMRHLAASTITARVDADRLPALRRRLDALGVTGPSVRVAAGRADPSGGDASGDDPSGGRAVRDGRITLEIPRGDVARVLALLADDDAQDLTCTPATLEDLFLRHYRVAAR